MKIEEFRIVETQDGFFVERLTQIKKFVYTHRFLGVGIYGKTIVRNEYLSIDLCGYGCKNSFYKNHPYSSKERAVGRIQYLVDAYNGKSNDVHKIYYPPFDEQK